MLARLSIRQKLSLLLAIPLVAVALVMAGYTVDRIGDARLHGRTADAALAARDVGALIQTLQHERLLALGYLAAPSLERSALVAQSQTSVDDTARLAADQRTAAVIAAAKPRLDDLAGIRLSVINRRIGAKVAYDAYRAANLALLDALRLGDPAVADAAGLSQLVALDALMRSNEEASSVGAIIVGSAVDPELSPTLLAQAVAADAQSLHRFQQLVSPEQASLVDLVENGQAGQKIHGLISDIIQQGHRPEAAAEVSDALTAAVTYTGLRRLAQDRVARDVAQYAESHATSAETVAGSVAAGAVVLFLGVLALAVTVSRSISQPLQRLTRAAGVVAELSRAELVRVADSDALEPAPPKLASVEVDSADEIGELAAAVNRVQATAALLLERQVTTRANVSTMFANIARRTQNLVGRQLQLIDELERNERDPELLNRLYQLDHVSTRLRRSADSLLVVSGTVDPQLSTTPTRLSDVIRSALAEIEGYRAVELGEISDVAISAEIVGDLRLLLAELLENATNFSPPGVPIQVTSMLDQDCTVGVVDHGLGMSPGRLDEENRRLLERERLDVAPTRVLGLFVVGRLARRHGLGVRLDPSPGRGITASVVIPARLLLGHAAGVGGPHVPAGPQHPSPALGVVPPLAIEAIRTAVDSGPFPWLGAQSELVAIAGAPAYAPVDASASETTSESPVADWSDGTGFPDRSWPPPTGSDGATVADAATAAGGLPRRNTTMRPVGAQSDDAFEDDDQTGSLPPMRGGLSQRIPGTHLAEAIRDGDDLSVTPRGARDPDTERDELNEYLSGFARFAGEPESERDSQPTLAERHS
jgi:signal transduction histidine kinase